MRTALPLLVIGALTGAALSPALLPALAGPIETPTPTVPLDGTYNPARSFSPLVKAVEPAVVSLQVSQTQVRSVLTVYGPQARPYTSTGEGSGFIVSEDGLLLTNAHVVAGADEITATFADGQTRTAEVLGYDRAMDVALLKLQSGKYPYVPMGDSTDLEVGDWVLAMGNPLGLGHTVTAGIVSAKGRVLGHHLFGDRAFIQTDAAINQGNSGGPLFDLEGNVVGINTMIIAGANTVGFSIPIEEVEAVIKDLEETGRVRRGYAGVRPIPLNARLAATLDVSVRNGAVLAEVFEGTPAAKSGLKPGDVVVEVEGEPVNQPDDLFRHFGGRRPGETIQVIVARPDGTHTLRLTLGESPPLRD